MTMTNDHDTDDDFAKLVPEIDPAAFDEFEAMVNGEPTPAQLRSIESGDVVWAETYEARMEAIITAEAAAAMAIDARRVAAGRTPADDFDVAEVMPGFVGDA